MAKLENITVMTQTRYVFVIFPFATYKRVGEIGLLTVFGIPIYKRVGEIGLLTVFGIPTYKRVGEIGLLTVFGIPIYKRVDDVRSLFGFKYVARCSCANCKMVDGYSPCARRP